MTKTCASPGAPRASGESFRPGPNLLVAPAKAGAQSTCVAPAKAGAQFPLMNPRYYYVYILATGTYGTLYVGITNDLVVISTTVVHRTAVCWWAQGS